MTEDGLRSLDERARRLGVDRLVADADFRIANDGDLDAFIARSAAVLADILAAPLRVRERLETAPDDAWTPALHRPPALTA